MLDTTEDPRPVKAEAIDPLSAMTAADLARLNTSLMATGAAASLRVDSSRIRQRLRARAF